MSGVHRKAAAEVAGLEEVKNSDLRGDGTSTPSEMSEKYGEEKHKNE